MPRLRLYPQPDADLVTPFHTDDGLVYQRLVEVGDHDQPTTWTYDLDGAGEIRLNGAEPTWRLPDRPTVLSAARRSNNRALIEFCSCYAVAPAFSPWANEAVARIVVRQVVRACHARRVWARLIRDHGLRREHLFGFLDQTRLSALTTTDYEALGLGFRAARLEELMRAIGQSDWAVPTGCRGFGPWSRAVLAVEAARDYSIYPMDDLSGSAVSALFGVDLVSLQSGAPVIAADIYLYGVSYLESLAERSPHVAT